MQQPAPISYRCINPACGHAMPRVVKFCPYCGLPQQEGVLRPVLLPEPLFERAAISAPAVVAAVVAHVEPELPAFPAAAPPAAPPPFSAPEPVQAAPLPRRPAAAPAMPPQRRPLHWIWWLIGAAVLWLAWLTARPAAHKFDSRVDAAISLAQACKGKQAQSELIALRATRATPAQLQRLQTALNDAAGACSRKLVRDKAWTDAVKSIDAALSAAAPDKARTRLNTFTRRWGEDDETAAAMARIEASKRAAPEAAAAPAPTAAQSRESAANLMTEAERDIGRGNYKGAIDKMETCLDMVDAGNRACSALKLKAERLYQGL